MNKEELRQELEKFAGWFKDELGLPFEWMKDFAPNDEIVQRYFASLEEPTKDLGMFEEFGKLVSDFDKDIQEFITKQKEK